MGRATEAFAIMSGEVSPGSRKLTHLDGAWEIRRMMERLEKKESAKAARAAIRETNREIMQPAVKQNAKTMVGGDMGDLISKKTRVKAMKRMRSGSYGSQVYLAPEEEFIYYTKDEYRFYIPFAIEYGHAFPGRGRGRNAPKDVPANPFMAEAYERNRYRASNLALSKLWNKLETHIKQNEVNKGVM